MCKTRFGAPRFTLHDMAHCHWSWQAQGDGWTLEGGCPSMGAEPRSYAQDFADWPAWPPGDRSGRGVLCRGVGGCRHRCGLYAALVEGVTTFR